jgi:membrane-associated phospholipid phosphatase
MNLSPRLSRPGRAPLLAAPPPAAGHPRRHRDVVVVTLLALSVAVAVPDTRRIGDTLQVVLPLMALGCAAAKGEAGPLVGRYLVLEAGIKIPKAALGDAPVNRRPDGGGRGFPSGHTAAATFGAAHLIVQCVGAHPGVRGALLLGAAFTGGSRIEAGRHTLWQTTAGALWGWAAAVLPAPWAWRRRRAPGRPPRGPAAGR